MWKRDVASEKCGKFLNEKMPETDILRVIKLQMFNKSRYNVLSRKKNA